ncbi:hypothetical protein M422DRAFT_247710 [Sphaerobolus stellatus SS14]|nr:hypothetical protein M422DRAFT_247710 [Sphaerobolus stellatus SS14]
MAQSNGPSATLGEAGGTHAHLGLNLPGAQQNSTHNEPNRSGIGGQSASSTSSASSPTGARLDNSSASAPMGTAQAPQLPENPPADPQNTLRQENDDLRARLARLEAQQAASITARPFISDEEFETLRAQTSTLKE